jgi:hypothetical protein
MGTWTTVATPSAGAIVAAAWGNSVKDATDDAAYYRPKFRVYRNSGGLIGDSAGTISATVSVNVADVVYTDNDGMVSGGVVTVQTPGVWVLMLSAEWLWSAGAGLRSISINTSAGTYLAADSMTAYGTVGSVNSSTYQYITSVGLLSTGTVLQARVAQSSGGSLGLYTGDWGLSLSGFLVCA